MRKSRVPTYVNYISALWFWVTILGVFYIGLNYVIPVLYQGYSDDVMLLHHVFAYFLFCQMVMNWACIKFVSSRFRPEDYPSINVDDIVNAGFEINLNHLKAGAEKGTYKLPSTSLPVTTSSNGNCNTSSSSSVNNTIYLVSLPSEFGYDDTDDSRKLVYPYWSWKPCLVCQIQRPPRTHHCPLCNVCVLKRDHHCFFTNSCIGLRNQRYFIVFSFWSSVAITHCLIHSAIFTFSEFIPRNSLGDALLPVTFVRWLLGWTSSLDLIMVVLLYSLIWFSIVTVGFLAEQIRCLRKGVTSFEEDNNIKITNVSSIGRNIRGVFGRYWWINFFIPSHPVLPAMDDGIHWPSVKA